MELNEQLYSRRLLKSSLEETEDWAGTGCEMGPSGFETWRLAMWSLQFKGVSQILEKDIEG